jgi:hypothetical protein
VDSNSLASSLGNKFLNVDLGHEATPPNTLASRIALEGFEYNNMECGLTNLTVISVPS